MLPEFNELGMLPPGDYELTLEELRASRLITGEGVRGQWDTAWRLYLVDRLAVLVHQLWAVGVHDIFVDGSFAEDKAHPNDIDGYFVCDDRRFYSGELQRELNLLDEHKVWTWSPAARRQGPRGGKAQLPMWHHYRVELYPHLPGIFSGIHDQFGHNLEFPSAFRMSRRDGRPRGIIKIGGAP